MTFSFALSCARIYFRRTRIMVNCQASIGYNRLHLHSGIWDGHVVTIDLFRKHPRINSPVGSYSCRCWRRTLYCRSKCSLVCSIITCIVLALWLKNERQNRKVLSLDTIFDIKPIYYSWRCASAYNLHPPKLHFYDFHIPRFFKVILIPIFKE